MTREEPATIPVPATRPASPRRRLGPALGIVIATIALFAFSWAVEPQSVSHSSLLGMLPFAGILAITAMGQTLVIQQGVIDLSVPGMLSLTVVLMTRFPNGESGKLLAAVLISLAALLAAGTLNGILVSRVGITSIVTTLGMNALLYGAVIQISGGTPRSTTARLHSLNKGDVIGIPVPVFVAAALALVVWFAVKRMVVGRRFEAVGASNTGARAAGLVVRRYQLSAYVGATVLYCAAGVLLAGGVSTSTAFPGDSYLLPSPAAGRRAGP